MSSTFSGRLGKALEEKFRDINTPGFIATLTPDEADMIFFEEPAIDDEYLFTDASDLLDTID